MRASDEAIEQARQFMRRDLIAYTRQTFKGYRVAEFHRIAARTLEQVDAGSIRRLIINWPPRHGKSELATRKFTAWALGRNPMREIIIAANTADLAEGFSYHIRKLLRSRESQFVFPGVQPAKDAGAITEWRLEQGGGLRAVGVGGTVTGKGANIFIIDDPIKGAEQARSPTILKKQREWYAEEARTRLAPGGAMIITQTRWSQGDLTGAVEDELKGTTPWTKLVFPALNEATNEWLWPERFPVDEYLDVMATMSKYSFSALYQQSPIPLGGGVLDSAWFKRIALNDAPRAAAFKFFAIGLDLAVTTSTYSAYTVAIPIGVHLETGDLYLFPPYRKQANWVDANREIINLTKAVQATTLGFEKYGQQEGFADLLRAELPGVYVSTEGSLNEDKLTRASAEWAMLAKSGRMWVVDNGAGWVEIFYAELDNFPDSGTTCDIIDAITNGVRAVRLREGASVVRRSGSEDLLPRGFLGEYE